MAYASEVAFRYRAKAEELRTLADLDGLDNTRRMLLSVADSYDQMARQVEAIAHLNDTFERHLGPIGHA